MLKTITSVGFNVLLILILWLAGANAQPAREYKYPADNIITSPNCNEFTFDATDSLFPPDEQVSFLWDFGDGHTSLEPTVTHTYESSGDYKVSLSIIDNSGFICSTARTTRIARAVVPVHATFKSKERVCVNEPVVFDGSDSTVEEGRRMSLTWEFSDGTIIQNKPKAVKTFQWGGEYDVSLTVSDQSNTPCGRQTVIQTIHVNEPPQAQAGDDLILKCIDGNNDLAVHFNANQTTDRNEDILSYHWDFGDGRKSMGKEVLHHYAEAGQYEAKLIVSDNTDLSCSSDIDFVTVKLNHAPRANAGEDITICAGTQIDFDGSESFIYKKGTALAKWYFGDGVIKQGLKVKHRYARPGTYEALLTLENRLNTSCPIARDTRLVHVKEAPTTDIKTSGEYCVDTQVHFDATSSMDPEGGRFTYEWNLGDGTIVLGHAQITHIYARGGEYPVSVKIDDNKGTKCSQSVAWTNVTINTPPVADAGSNFACCADEITEFSAEYSKDEDGDPLTYTWDFGDGTRKRGKNVTHTYRQKGSFDVRLTVDDNSRTSCSRSSNGFTAVVREFPLPIISIK